MTFLLLSLNILLCCITSIQNVVNTFSKTAYSSAPKARLELTKKTFIIICNSVNLDLQYHMYSVNLDLQYHNYVFCQSWPALSTYILLSGSDELTHSFFLLFWSWSPWHSLGCLVLLFLFIISQRTPFLTQFRHYRWTIYTVYIEIHNHAYNVHCLPRCTCTLSI